MGKSIKETLSEIRKMRENLMDAIRQERFATEPMLDDLRLLPDIYKVFCDILPNIKHTTYGRKVFTFIAFYLYAPRKFFGGRMPKDYALLLAGAQRRGQYQRCLSVARSY